MYRYLALSWNANNPAKVATVQRMTRSLLSGSSDWQRVFDAPGLRVFHRPHMEGAYCPYVLKGDGGVVLGKLFESDPTGTVTSPGQLFDERESDRLIESQGRRLVERYWGHYVAFLRAPDKNTQYLLRDPTGGMPCYMVQAGGVDVILSDMEDCSYLELAPFTVDWEHVTSFFLHSRLITQTTGFREVTSLHAGACASISYGKDGAAQGSMNTSFYWDPAKVCEANVIENPDVARANLRATIRGCVNAWASSYKSIVHELSGGLDSSVIAACIADHVDRPAVACLHYFTAMSEGDERLYAQLAAESTGLELIETEASPVETPLERLLDRTRLATPSCLGFNPGAELLKRRLVTERHAGAIFSGQGGDHLLQHDRTRLIAAEYASRHGLRLPLLRIAKDTSRMTSKSIWSVWQSVTRYGLLGKPFDPYAFHFKAPDILSDEASASLSFEAITHPWVLNASQLPANKVRQTFNVVDCQAFFKRQPPNAELVHPLVSQPLIELCLRIPTYVLAHRGMPRGLMREAFAEDLPTELIRRRSKGGTTSYFSQMLVENAAFLRERLLDGVMVNQGILNRGKLETLLREGSLIRGTAIAPIMSSLRAETWLSNWDDARQRTAA